MPNLPLLLAPHPALRKIAAPVPAVTGDVCKLMDDLLDTIHDNHGIGIAAPMVEIPQRVIVVDVEQDGAKHTLRMANPDILARSSSLQTFDEASLCYPGISAPVSRPDRITVRYLDYHGELQTLDASGFLATVIQHEMDYLDGKVYLDYISKLKRDRLLKKMEKSLKYGHACHSGCEH